MTHQYVIKTESGNFYEIIDESHLWHPDTRIIMSKGQRCVILSFSKYKIKQSIFDHARGRSGVKSWRELEGGVTANIKSGNCIRHMVLSINEDLIRPYMKTRILPPTFWTDVVAKHYKNTSRIMEVYKKIH